jgi:hypothetical protein
MAARIKEVPMLRACRWMLGYVAPLLLAASMITSSALAQCSLKAAIPSLQGTAGEVVCVSVVPIGVVASADLSTGCPRRYVIKPEDGTGGNWGFLDFAPCRGGICGADRSEQLECQLVNGYSCSGGIGSLVSTMTGARRGALRDGMQARFGSDTDRRQDLCFDQYIGNGRRIVVLPLTTPPGAGRGEVQILGFAAFFLSALPDVAGDAIEAEFLHLVLPGR